MTDVVFHLGDRKTGSTSIQNVLKAGAWRCEGVKLAYPQGKRVHHVSLARSLTDEPRFGQRRRRFRDMDAWIAGSGADVAVISSERFELADPADLKAAIEAHMPRAGGGVRCVAYVRPHAERVLSGFAERQKSGGFLGDLEGVHARMLDGGTLLYAPRFRRWREAFGDRFELRPMIRERLIDRDVVRDFLATALRTEDFEVTARADINTSLPLRDLVMVREFWLRARRSGRDLSAVKHAMGWAMGALLSAEPAADRTKLGLHRSLAERIREDYAADAAALDAEFFEGAPMAEALSRAVETAAPEASPLEAEAHFAPEELARLHAWFDLTLTLLDRGDLDWPRTFNGLLKAENARRLAAAEG